MLHYWENHDVSQLKDGQISGLGNDCEIIKPKFNRLIIFDASKLHAVAKVTKGRRRAIAINLWLNKPLTFSEQTYSPRMKEDDGNRFLLLWGLNHFLSLLLSTLTGGYIRCYARSPAGRS